MSGIKISGLGKSVPKKVLSNDEIGKFVDTSDEWIKSRTGISSRYIATDETTTTLAVEAARQAIQNSKLSPSDIGLVIVATVSGDTTMPSIACKVANEVGICEATCFDVAAACSGFVYATQIASNFIKLETVKNALVIGAEVLSRTLDWSDRNTCVLFGDGAGAVVYSFCEDDKISPILTGSMTSGNKEIVLESSWDSDSFTEGDKPKKGIFMNGKAVYGFATTTVPKSINQVLEKANLAPDDIDYYVLHQANERIMDRVANSLGVSKDKFFKNLQTHGNTSAASIPMALYDLSPQLKKGDKIITSGFGAGLTYGTMLIEWV